MNTDDLIIFGAAILGFVVFGGIFQNIGERVYWKWVERKYDRENKNE